MEINSKETLEIFIDELVFTELAALRLHGLDEIMLDHITNHFSKVALALTALLIEHYKSKECRFCGRKG